MTRTRLNQNQLPLRGVFSVERVLAARGFEVKQIQALTDTLLTAENPTEQQIDILFDTFDDPQSRLELLNHINSKSHNASRITPF